MMTQIQARKLKKGKGKVIEEGAQTKKAHANWADIVEEEEQSEDEENMADPKFTEITPQPTNILTSTAEELPTYKKQFLRSIVPYLPSKPDPITRPWIYSPEQITAATAQAQTEMEHQLVFSDDQDLDQPPNASLTMSETDGAPPHDNNKKARSTVTDIEHQLATTNLRQSQRISGRSPRTKLKLGAAKGSTSGGQGAIKEALREANIVNSLREEQLAANPLKEQETSDVRG